MVFAGWIAHVDHACFIRGNRSGKLQRSPCYQRPSRSPRRPSRPKTVTDLPPVHTRRPSLDRMRGLSGPGSRSAPAGSQLSALRGQLLCPASHAPHRMRHHSRSARIQAYKVAAETHYRQNSAIFWHLWLCCASSRTPDCSVCISCHPALKDGRQHILQSSVLEHRLRRQRTAPRACGVAFCHHVRLSPTQVLY